MDAGPYRGGDKRHRLVKGRDLIVYEEDREEKSISLAYTKSMETADIEKLEKAFQNIDTAKIQGAYAAMPPKGITRKESPAFILGSFSALFCFPLPYLYFFLCTFGKKGVRWSRWHIRMTLPEGTI